GHRAADRIVFDVIDEPRRILGPDRPAVRVVHHYVRVRGPAAILAGRGRRPGDRLLLHPVGAGEERVRVRKGLGPGPVRVPVARLLGHWVDGDAAGRVGEVFERFLRDRRPALPHLHVDRLQVAEHVPGRTTRGGGRAAEILRGNEPG